MSTAKLARDVPNACASMTDRGALTRMFRPFGTPKYIVISRRITAFPTRDRSHVTASTPSSVALSHEWTIPTAGSARQRRSHAAEWQAHGNRTRLSEKTRLGFLETTTQPSQALSIHRDGGDHRATSWTSAE